MLLGVLGLLLSCGERGDGFGGNAIAAVAGVGFEVTGVWRVYHQGARSASVRVWCLPGVVVCLCLSVAVLTYFLPCFFICMRTWQSFAYWGCDGCRATKRRNRKQAAGTRTRQDAWRVTSRGILKPARTPRYNRHTGSKEAAERDQPAAGTARRASSRDRRSAYSFSQRQAVDRHTNTKTPEPELEPAMQATMKTRQMPAQLLSWRVAGG